MKLNIYKFITRNIQWILAVCLFSIPFFWLKPGEMDLGGDSGRLYFYDPISFIKNVSLYHFVPEGLGLAEPNTYYLPYAALLAGLKFIFQSPTIVISIISGLKLSVGFLAIYGIIKEVTRSITLAPLMAGIFYITAPIMLGNYDKALTSHNQVFLNPLMFYLLLKFFMDANVKYLWIALWTSFIFAPNFSLTSAPPFFAFYPLSIVFLLLYTKFVLRKMIPWKWILVGGLMFLAIQAFHLLPQIINLFEPGSFTNTRVFDRASIMHEGVRYFTGILPLASVVNDIFMMPMNTYFAWVSVFAPFIIMFGFILNSKNKVFILTAGFYLVTLYLYAAKITNVGVEFYKHLYYIPGFSMFRNFIGQWPSVYAFFYALLLGFAVQVIIQKSSNRKWIPYLGSTIIVLWIASALPFLKGETVNKIHTQSSNVRMTFAMDPKYEETLAFIRSLPDDGKIVTFPLTDAYYQVLAGKNGGAYIGTSTISQLTGKKDFNGYQIFGPFAEDLMKYAREKDYSSFTNILSQLSIRYIFHNNDPAIYEIGFPQSPYTYMKTSFPQTQEGYEEFITNLPTKRIYANGSYIIYELDASVRRPEVYVVSGDTGQIDTRFQTTITRNDPTSYTMVLDRKEIKPDSMVFNNTFSSNWKLSVDGNQLPESSHYMLHGYANAWWLTQDEFDNKNSYTMTLRLMSQKYIWAGYFISAVSLILLGFVSFYTIHNKIYA